MSIIQRSEIDFYLKCDIKNSDIIKDINDISTWCNNNNIPVTIKEHWDGDTNEEDYLVGALFMFNSKSDSIKFKLVWC